MGEDITVKDLEEFLSEMEELDTEELMNTIDPDSLAYKLLNTDDLRTKYGNKVINSFDSLYKTIDKASIDFNESVIDIVTKGCKCTRQQAITKLALAWNIRVVEGKGKWFKQQLDIISHNKSVLANIDRDKYPLLYKQMTGRTKKYYDFMLDLYQCRLEACGLFYLGCNMPLVASGSYRFITKALRLKRTETVEDNINNLDRYGLIKKLSDEELMTVNTNQYEKAMKLKSNNGNSINSYQLIMWTDEVLALAEEHIAYGKSHGITNKSQNSATLSAHGYDSISKGTGELSADDAETFSKLEKWARNKFRYDRAVITNKEWQAKFYEFDGGKTYGPDRSNKMDRLRSMLIVKLDLIQIMASKDNRALFGGINNKKFEGIAPNSKMMVKRARYEELTRH